MKLRKWIAGATCVCMLLTLSPPAAVLAETMPQVTNSRASAETPYWDWDNSQKKLVQKKTDRAPQEVTSALKEWSAGWYIVNRDVILDARVVVTGKVHLILADGATLTLKGGIQVADDDDNVANGSANALTIYGQAQGSGALKIEGVDQENAEIGGNNGQRGGTITINGGAVTIANGVYGSYYGIGGNGANVTINAGAVTATARYSGIGGDDANVTINGGAVSAASTYAGSRGIGGPNANVVINGGTVTAGPPKYPGCGIEGASVAVNGGTVTASGNDSSKPGIKGGTVTIGSGTVIATGGVTIDVTAEGISKRQAQGIVGNFNTTVPGNAIIVAQSGIEDKTHKQNWQANIIIDGPEGIFNVNPLTLTEDLTIPEESNFVVPQGGTLEIPRGVTLTNKGTLTIDGHVDNSAGTLDNQGAVTGSGTLVKKVSQPAPVLSEISYSDLSIDKSDERINGWHQAYLLYDAPTGGTIIRDQTGEQDIHKFIDQGKSFYVGKRETDFCYASDRVLWFENTGRHPMPTLAYDADQGGVVVPGGYKYLYDQRPNPDWPYSKYYNGWRDGNGQLVKVEWGKKLYVYQARYSDKLNSPIQEIAVGTAPNGPQVESVTATTVTLQSIPPDDAGAPVEYSMDDGKNWQDSPTFTGLTPDTEYTFIARYKAHNGKPASANSWGGNITTESPNYELTVTAPTLEETYGYSQPAAKALTINCTGNIDATIQSVTLGADSKFEIVSSQDTTVPMGGENTSWKVQPKAGLDAGTYTDTITVTDKGGKTATAEVKLTVNKAAATVDTPPTAIEDLKYTGEEQVLITAGTAIGGELQYSLSEDEDTFKKDLPTGNKAASYRVFYRVKGDANHNDSKIGSVTVKIGKAEASITEAPKGKILTYNGEAQALVEAGVTSGGELQYSLQENRDFSTDIPKGTDAGKYTVYYRIVGDSSSSGQGTVWSVDTTIDKANAVVKQAPKPVENLVYTGKDQELVTAGTTNGCTLQYSTDGKTYSKALPKATDAGDYTVWYKVEGEKNYTDVAPQSVAVKIAKATPQVTVEAAKDLTYTGQAQDLIEAGTTSGGELQYSLTEKGDYSTDIPTGTNAGNYTVWYKVVGGDNYNDVAPQSVAATIQPANAVVTEPQAKTDLTYDGTAQALLTKGETNGGKWQYSTDGNTYQDAVPMATDAGTYTVHYKLNGEGNVKDIPATSVSVTIGKVTPQVTAPTAKTLNYTGQAQALIEAGATNGGTLQYSLEKDGTYDTAIPQGIDAKSYTVYYKVVGGKNYNDVAAKSITVTIDKATPQVKAPTAKTLTYTGQAQALITAGTTTGGTLQYSLDNKNYSTDIPQGTEAKTYTVYYKVVGDANYNNVDPQSITVKIAQAAASVETAPTAKQDLVYSGQSQALITEGTAKGGELQYSLKKDSDFSANIPTGKDADTYTVYYKVVGDANHADSEVKSVTVIIAKATANVTDTPKPVEKLIYTGKDQVLITAGKAEGGTMQYSLDKEKFSTELPTGREVQTYTVYYKVIGDKNHNDSPVAQLTVSIGKAPVALDQAPTAKDLTYTGKAQALVNAGTTTGGVLQYSLKADGEFSTEIPTAINADSYTVYYKVVGDDTHEGTTKVQQIAVTIKKANAKLTEEPTAKTGLVYSDELQTLIEAGTTEGGTLQYSLKADGEFSTTLPQAKNAGKHTVYYKVIGDQNYNGIEGVKTVDCAIDKATPKVTVEAAKDLTYTGQAQALIEAGTTTGGTLQYSLEKDGKYSTDIPTGTNADTYTVWYKVVGDANYNNVDPQSITVKIAQVAASVETAPTAKLGLVYNGQAQALINAGTATGGELQYSLSEKEGFSTAIPTGKDANTYTVYYKVVGDANHADSEVKSVTVIIAKATANVTDAPKPVENLAYTGADQVLITAGKAEGGTMQYSLNKEKDFSAELPKASKAGTHTVYYKAVGEDNYKDSDVQSVTVTIAQATATVKTEPKAVANLTYTGENQVLVEAGKAEGGTMQYSLSKKDGYSTALPTGKDAKDYTVYYKVVGDGNHQDSDVKSLTVSIAKAAAKVATAPTAVTTLVYNGENQVLVEAGNAEGGTMQYSLSEKDGYSTALPTGKDAKDYTVYYKVVGDNNHNDTVAAEVVVSIAKATPKVTAPTAKTLHYTGQAQALVNAGSSNVGTLEYSLDGKSYSTTIPSGTDVGDYTVWYQVEGNDNYNSVDAQKIAVTIAKAPQTALKAPEAESVTRTAITLKAVADSANGIKAEYGIKTGDGSFKWQANPAFDNLSEGTNYTFKVRYAESANYLGAESAEAVIRTDRTPSKPVNPPSKPIDPPTVPDVEGGDVTVTPSRPTSGQTVTITPQPEDGMVVDKVIVTDKNGNKIEVTQKPNGDFTFEQPSSEVTVTVTFKPEGEEGPSGDLPFNDVPEGAWYEDAVEYVYENGLIMGVADGQFAPNMTTDRGQLVTMLWRLAGEPQAENSTDFGDVPSSAYYAKAVAWAAENGITAGFEDGTFRPTTGLSREQMAALFMKYAQAIGLDTSARADISGFTDINPDSWSYDALSWAKAVGLLNGVGDATMAPQDTATRAQIAAVLQRYCETIAK